MHSSLIVLAEAAMFAWGAIPAVADWYGATGSAHPNPSTGQTSLIKGIHAVGYGTAQQAMWFSNLPIAVFALLALLAWAGKSSGYGQRRKEIGRRLGPHPVFIVVWIALLFGGGHWISLYKTGAWTFPDHQVARPAFTSLPF